MAEMTINAMTTQTKTRPINQTTQFWKKREQLNKKRMQL